MLGRLAAPKLRASGRGFETAGETEGDELLFTKTGNRLFGAGFVNIGVRAERAINDPASQADAFAAD